MPFALARPDVQVVQVSWSNRLLPSAQARTKVFGLTRACWPGQSNTTVWTETDAGCAGAACAGPLKVNPVIVSPAPAKVSAVAVSTAMNQARFTTPPQAENSLQPEDAAAGRRVGPEIQNRVSWAGD